MKEIENSQVPFDIIFLNAIKNTTKLDKTNYRAKYKKLEAEDCSHRIYKSLKWRFLCFWQILGPFFFSNAIGNVLKR